MKPSEFRQWANQVLKEYLLRGYVVNTRITALEQHAVKHDAQIQELKSKVDFFVRSSLPPVEGIFYDGQIFDAYAHIISLIKQARQSIILIDNYINVDTLSSGPGPVIADPVIAPNISPIFFESSDFLRIFAQKSTHDDETNKKPYPISGTDSVVWCLRKQCFKDRKHGGK